VYRVLVRKPEGINYLKDSDVDVTIILKWIFEKRHCSMAWLQVAQNKKKWRAFVNAIMNVWVPYNAENFLTTLGPVSFSEKLCSMELFS
jgi:hypothetical protein